MGSSRAERLDPFALPVRFVDADRAADEQVRQVELHRERVVLRRMVGGIKMSVNLPVNLYLGVVLRMEPATSTSEAVIAVVLEHNDPALSLTLCRACENSDVVADWRSWARALGLPLLVVQSDGRLREAFARLDRVWTGSPIGRRRRSSMRGRRASIPLRRGHGSLARMARIHAGEREIIARN